MLAELYRLSNNFQWLLPSTNYLSQKVLIFMHLGLVTPGYLLEWKRLILWPMGPKHVYLMHRSYVPCVCVRSLIKMEQTIKKAPNFGEVIINTRATHNQSFNVLDFFVLVLLGFTFYVYTMFVYSISEFNKNKTNYWNNTKLCRSYHQY